jgi:hypothetical protein
VDRHGRRPRQLDDEHARQVRTAFEAWQRTGIPVRFAFVADSARADIHVGWWTASPSPIERHDGGDAADGKNAWWIVERTPPFALTTATAPARHGAGAGRFGCRDRPHLIVLGSHHGLDEHHGAQGPRCGSSRTPSEQTARLLYSGAAVRAHK